MTEEELYRRISAALDSPDGLEGDLELQTAFAMDPEVARIGDEVRVLDEALRRWPEPPVAESALDALARRVEQRLDEALPNVPDPTAPPVFDDELPTTDREPAHDESAEVYSLERLAHASHPTFETWGADGDTSAETLSSAVLKPGSWPPSPPTPVEDARPAPAWNPGALPPVVPDADPMAFAGHGRHRPEPSGAMPSGLTGERVSFPRVDSTHPSALPDPFAPTMTPPRSSRRGLYWTGALAAAAALGMVSVVGVVTLTSDEPEVAYAPSAARPEEAPDQGPMAPSAPAEGTAATEDRAGRETDRAADSIVGDSDLDFAPSGNTGPGAIGRFDSDSDSARGSRGFAETSRSRAAPPARRATSTSEAAPAADLPEPAEPALTPSREAVVAAMITVAPAVRACAGERRGVAHVEVVVGSSGRVRTAQVTGDFGGSSEGSCMALAVREARFAPFTQDVFRFTFPFQIP